MDIWKSRVAVFKKVGIVLSFFMLSSCSMLSPVKTDSADTFELNTLPSVPVYKSGRATTLVVMPIETTPVYNTSQIAYTIRPFQVSYYAKNRWIAPPANMLQPLLIQALQKTHYFRAVISPQVTGRFNYVLNMQLIKLQQDFTYPVSVVKLVAQVQLMRATDGQLIANKQFSVVVDAPQNNPYGGVMAANRATAILLKQITLFCIHSLSAHN
jgi:cholesterol transport system auxiliary component